MKKNGLVKTGKQVLKISKYGISGLLNNKIVKLKNVNANERNIKWGKEEKNDI